MMLDRQTLWVQCLRCDCVVLGCESAKRRHLFDVVLLCVTEGGREDESSGYD